MLIMCSWMQERKTGSDMLQPSEEFTFTSKFTSALLETDGRIPHKRPSQRACGAQSNSVPVP